MADVSPGDNGGAVTANLTDPKPKKPQGKHLIYYNQLRFVWGNTLKLGGGFNTFSVILPYLI